MGTFLLVFALFTLPAVFDDGLGEGLATIGTLLLVAYVPLALFSGCPWAYASLLGLFAARTIVYWRSERCQS